MLPFFAGANDPGSRRTTPAAAASLTSSQLVSLGLNVTFSLIDGVTLSACGEGSGGRLGLGHSEDQRELQPLSGLSGGKK